MKTCIYNINEDIEPIKECGKEAKWEVGFCYASWEYEGEGSGENEFQGIFCNKHFVEMGSSGNSVEFRKIGNKKWIEIHEWDLVLQDFVDQNNKQ